MTESQSICGVETKRVGDRITTELTRGICCVIGSRRNLDLVLIILFSTQITVGGRRSCVALAFWHAQSVEKKDPRHFSLTKSSLLGSTSKFLYNNGQIRPIPACEEGRGPEARCLVRYRIRNKET